MSLKIHHEGSSSNLYYVMLFWYDSDDQGYVYDLVSSSWVNYNDALSGAGEEDIHFVFGISLDHDLIRSSLFFADIDLTVPDLLEDNQTQIEATVWVRVGSINSIVNDTRKDYKVVGYDFSTGEEFDQQDLLDKIDSIQFTVEGSFSEQDSILLRQVYERLFSLSRK